MEWTTVTVIIALVGLGAAIIKPIVSLTRSITELTSKSRGCVPIWISRPSTTAKSTNACGIIMMSRMIGWTTTSGGSAPWSTKHEIIPDWAFNLISLKRECKCGSAR